jgi:hypothetical protein
VTVASLRADARDVSSRTDDDEETIDHPGAEMRDATLLLAAVLASIYAIDAAASIAVAPGEGAVLLGIAGLQAAWLMAARRLRNGALLSGGALNVSLVSLWLVTRTVGLPIGTGGSQPVGVLDALCAFDSAALAALAWTLGRPSAQWPKWAAAQSRSVAIVLAVGSLAALHVLGASPQRASVTTAGEAGHRYHFFCQLL